MYLPVIAVVVGSVAVVVAAVVDIAAVAARTHTPHRIAGHSLQQPSVLRDFLESEQEGRIP